MTGNKKNRQKLFRTGFSLIEVMVSVAIFSVIILSSTQIFKMIIDGQRGAIAAQNVEESLKYFSEVTGKEMRMAQKNSDLATACPGIPVTSIFWVTHVNSTTDSLKFKNRYGECVTYTLGIDNGQPRFFISRGVDSAYISPAKISIDKLNFVVNEAAQTQPIVMINLRAHSTDQAQFKSDMTIQTSITSRYYK